MTRRTHGQSYGSGRDDSATRSHEAGVFDLHVDAVLFIAALLVASCFMQPMMAQQASRYALTAALVDDHTASISRYAHMLGVDFADREARLYSDKAPGQPVMAVPAYVLYRVLGGSSAADDARGRRDWGLWSVTVASASLPAAFLLVLMRRLCLRGGSSDRVAIVAATSLWVGSMLLPFSRLLFTHVLSGALGLLAWLLMSQTRPSRYALLAGGFLLAATGTVEYSTAPIGATTLLCVALLHRRRAAWVVLGCIPPILALAVYHTAIFSHPLAVPYMFDQFEWQTSGLVGPRPPDARTTIAVLFGERGLFSLTPLVLVAFVGTAVKLRRNARAQDLEAALTCAIGLTSVIALVALMGGWGNPYGGASPGPRYIVPALPWLVVGVAQMADKAPVVTRTAAVLSAVPMILATLTQPLAQPDESVALRWWLDLAVRGQFSDTVLTSLPTSVGVLLPTTLAIGFAGLVIRADRSRQAMLPERHT